MFKFVVICAFVGLACAGNAYNRAGSAHKSHHSAYSAPSHSAYSAPSSHVSHNSGDDAHAEVLVNHSDVRADGFEYNVETSNGIHAESSGDAYGNVHGSYAYISPEGEHVQLTYVADENGYQPSSSLLPTPPPVPEAIVRALAYIAAHPHKEESYGHAQATFGRKH